MALTKHYPAWNKVVTYDSNGPKHHTLIETDAYKAVIVSLEAGMKIPPHPAADAAYHFLEGSGLMYVGEERLSVKAGETMVVPAGVLRGVEAETRLAFLGSHGVAQKENRRPAMKVVLPMMLGAMLMVALMIGGMILPAQLMGSTGGLGLRMWGVMLIPFLGMGVMVMLMFFFNRSMTGDKRMSVMMSGHSHMHEPLPQSTEDAEI